MRNRTPYLTKNTVPTEVRFVIAEHPGTNLATLLYGAADISSSLQNTENSRPDATRTAQLALLRDDWISSGNRSGQ